MAQADRKRLDHNAYTVGWLCPLEVEMSAARYLLDEEHQRLPSAGHPNQYVLGQVNGHNVVIASLPAGYQGTVSAATVAIHMGRTFPSISLRLLVGIGGGVPSKKNDIWLGDVVVGIPTGIHGGVVEYDLGKQTSTGFERKGFLSPPPTEWLQAVILMKSDHRIAARKVSAFLDELLERHPGLTEYKRPSPDQDVLFDAGYDHVSGQDSCNNCDHTRVQKRAARKPSDEPVIHYGLIASGDRVMKDAAERDRISRACGGAICFEMEAAGLMNDFGCIVVRGISDYADSHKNDDWHAYGAAAAAALAKELLTYMEGGVSGRQQAGRQQGSIFLVPYASNPDFVGRSNILDKLKEYLSHGHQRGRVTSQARAALFGLGGIGKTQIALAYAYWVWERFPTTAIFWVHASSPERFHQGYSQIARECKVPGCDDPKADVLQLVKAWFERRDQGAWLMIIDNADDSEMFFSSGRATSRAPNSTNLLTLGGKFGRYVPECSHSSILVTTRNKQAGVKFTRGSGVIEVGQMDLHESSRLIQGKLQNDRLDPMHVSRLADRLENLPLALVQATAFIQENSLTVTEYLQLLEQSDSHLVELLSQPFEEVGRDSSVPNAVTATWMVSFKQMREQYPQASNMLSLMSFFDRQGVPEVFLSQQNQKGQDQSAFGQDDEAVRVIALRKAIGILKAFSFVSAGKADDALDMHRLLQLVMRKWLFMRGEHRAWASQALSTVSSLFPYGHFEHWKVCSSYLPHVYAVLSLERMESAEEEVARASLLHCAAGYMLAYGRRSKAEELLRQAVATRKNVLGDQHPDTLASMANLASMFWDQGRWMAAEELEVQVLEMRKNVLGGQHPDTLTSMANLASMFLGQGRYTEAEELDVQVMKTSRKVLGEEHPDTLTSMTNLALSYQNQGRWVEAKELGVQVMGTTKKVLGSDHPATLTSMANLASTYQNQGRWKEAEELDMQVMEARKRILGGEHPGTLASIASLASTYRNQGRWKEAEELEVQVIETTKKVLGSDHPNTLASMANLASTYRSQRRWVEVEELEVQLIKAWELVIGRDHPETLTSMANLASTYRSQGRLEEAAAMMKKVLEKRRLYLGEEHPDTITAMNDLTVTLQDQGRLEEARILGEEHPKTQLAAESLAALALQPDVTSTPTYERKLLLERARRKFRKLFARFHGRYNTQV